MLPSVVQLPLMMTSKVLWGLVEVGMLLNLDVHNPHLIMHYSSTPAHLPYTRLTVVRS